MSSLNAIDPTPEQIKAFLSGSADDKPVFMLNLLKFKEMKDLNIEGAETVFGGNTHQYLIGEGDWDAVAIVRYPNAQTMFNTVSSDAYRKIHYHRKAGLEGQLLINCDDIGIF